MDVAKIMDEKVGSISNMEETKTTLVPYVGDTKNLSLVPDNLALVPHNEFMLRIRMKKPEL